MPSIDVVRAFVTQERQERMVGAASKEILSALTSCLRPFESSALVPSNFIARRKVKPADRHGPRTGNA